MKEHKGQNALNWRLFLGFSFVLIGIDADRLNLTFRWTECCRPAVLEPISNA